MSGTPANGAPDGEGGPTSVSPGAAALWRSSRPLVLGVVVLLVAGLGIAALRSGEQPARQPRDTALPSSLPEGEHHTRGAR